MDFCPNCETKLVLGRGKEGAELWLSCPRCEYRKKLTETSSPSLIKQMTPIENDIVTVVEDQETSSNLVTVRFDCPKCGNDSASQWSAQTQWTDESATQFYRCTKCGYTTRG